MCTLILANGHYPGRDLVVAANRDESLSRPAGPPRLWDSGSLRFLAPEDHEAGGTWMGLNERGVFAGLTNRFVPGPTPGALESGRRSRGLLVLDALSHPTAGAAVEALLRHAGHRHNPFHLAVADRSGAHLLWSDGEALYHEGLPPGLHILTERSMGAAPSGRIDVLEGAPLSFDGLQGELSVHREPSFEGTCVHWTERNYGTRSSCLLSLGEEPRYREFLFTEGPPCTSPWTDGRGLLSQLGF